MTSWMTSQHVWVAIGFLGQFAFASRFLVQWAASERAQRVVVPKLFWYLSLAGGLVLLAYAVHRRDVVFSIGQASGLAVYARNLVLHRTPSVA
jgi:lipid-A-disaccharide synthase-like uncharacterized protein